MSTSAAATTAASSRAAAVSQSATSQATATSRVASAAASTGAIAQSSATTSGAASAAASTSQQSSSASTSSSTSTSSSSISSLISSTTSTSTSSSASSSASVGSSNAAATDTSGSKGLSNGAIGGIAGGAAGGILLLILAWMLWRRRKDKKDWVPPPPPREMAYNSQSTQRQRVASSTMLGGGGSGNINRASSYSTLIQPRPSSTYNSHSRQPSYYASYPVATPSSMSHDTSPPMPATASNSSEGSPQMSGLNTPAKKPSLTPINTTLHRDGSSGSGSSEGVAIPRNKSSVDRLREKETSSSGSRAPSPVSFHGPSAPSEGSSSRATSPMPSPYPGRQSGQLSPGYSRPYSMHSLSSSRYHHAPMGGAPHQRPIALEMPKLLGARPDSTGDFFQGIPRSADSMQWGTLDGHVKRPSRALTENDFAPPSPRHTRGPSNLSWSSRPYPDQPPEGQYRGDEAV